MPPASQGIFYVNGVVLSAASFPGLVLTPAQLSFAPAAGFGGSAGFSYSATDDAGIVSTPATYAAPVGKDGSPTLLANPSTYYPATASAAAGATTLVVDAGTQGSAAAVATISKGDLLLVIQMQGIDIDYSNTDTYGDNVAGGGASGTLPTNLQAGTYEYMVATNATPLALAGGSITLAAPLANNYLNSAATTTAGPGRFQAASAAARAACRPRPPVITSTT